MSVRSFGIRCPQSTIPTTGCGTVAIRLARLIRPFLAPLESSIEFIRPNSPFPPRWGRAANIVSREGVAMGHLGGSPLTVAPLPSSP